MTTKNPRGPWINSQLPDLPDEATICRGIRDAPGRDPRVGRAGVTANILAGHLGVQGARRLGNGAMKGSWTGSMVGGLRLAPRLRAMERRGLLIRIYDRENYRYTVVLTKRGVELADECADD